jgi:hypothetical protein
MPVLTSEVIIMAKYIGNEPPFYEEVAKIRINPSNDSIEDSIVIYDIEENVQDSKPHHTSPEVEHYDSPVQEHVEKHDNAQNAQKKAEVVVVESKSNYSTVDNKSIDDDNNRSTFEHYKCLMTSSENEKREDDNYHDLPRELDNDLLQEEDRDDSYVKEKPLMKEVPSPLSVPLRTKKEKWTIKKKKPITEMSKIIDDKETARLAFATNDRPSTPRPATRQSTHAVIAESERISTSCLSLHQSTRPATATASSVRTSTPLPSLRQSTRPVSAASERTSTLRKIKFQPSAKKYLEIEDRLAILSNSTFLSDRWEPDASRIACLYQYGKYAIKSRRQLEQDILARNKSTQFEKKFQARRKAASSKPSTAESSMERVHSLYELSKARQVEGRNRRNAIINESARKKAENMFFSPYDCIDRTVQPFEERSIPSSGKDISTKMYSFYSDSTDSTETDSYDKSLSSSDSSQKDGSVGIFTTDSNELDQLLCTSSDSNQKSDNSNSIHKDGHHDQESLEVKQ